MEGLEREGEGERAEEELYRVPIPGTRGMLQGNPLPPRWSRPEGDTRCKSREAGVSGGLVVCVTVECSKQPSQLFHMPHPPLSLLDTLAAQLTIIGVGGKESRGNEEGELDLDLVHGSDGDALDIIL
jgi:hypothetical protein